MSYLQSLLGSVANAGEFDDGSSSGTDGDANTLLLLHLDSNFDNSCTTPRIVTEVGGIAISATNPKFGAGSAQFDGSDDAIEINESTDWAFGSSNFTVDFWFRVDSTTQESQVFIFGDPDGTEGWAIDYYDNEIHFYDLNSDVFLTSTTTFAVDTWYHVAAVRNGTSWNLYIGGTSEDSATSSITIDGSGDLIIGYLPGSPDSAWYDGNLDEIRLSDVARWTTNFTPPTSPYS